MIHLWSNNMWQCRSLLSLSFFCPSFRPSFLATNYVQAHDVDDVLPEQTALEAGCQSLLDTYFSSHFKWPCKLFRHSQTRMCLLKKFQRRVIGMHLPLYKIIALLADKVWGTMIHLETIPLRLEAITFRLEAMALRLEAIATRLGWRPSLLGWRPSLLGSWPSLLGLRPSRLGWRPSLLGWRSSRLGWRPSRLGWRPSLLGWRPSLLGWVGGHPS